MNYKEIFLEHFIKYPLMLPNDFFKLIYQNSHGPHHLNLNNITINFHKELSILVNPPKYQLENIGNDYTRVYLNPLWNTNDRESVLDAFIKSNIDYRPNISLLYEELDLLKELVMSNIININIDQFLNELDNYLTKGPHAVSHTNDYKNSYHFLHIVLHIVLQHPIIHIF